MLYEANLPLSGVHLARITSSSVLNFPLVSHRFIIREIVQAVNPLDIIQFLLI